jgi:exopolyphosphatase / guanosine-5'-triphosphate,3'-diphosphate pyrophosphatase
MKFAAIDIGSNAARLQISSVLENEGVISFKRIEYVRFALRLGHDVFSDGLISPESEVRIFKLMHAYKLLMDLHEVKDYAICATSANSAEIITRIHKILDMKIQLIDGSREAELINDVVVQSLHPKKNYLHIDVGGGSTELNIYRNREKLASKSFKIGSVRLLEGTEKEGDWEKMRNWISKIVDSGRNGSNWNWWKHRKIV